MLPRVIIIIMKDLAEQASDILTRFENYQWEIGKLANEVVEKFGYKAIEEFSKEIESVGGVKRKPSTLRMYAYTYKMAMKLNLPKDILFTTCQSIVFSDDPQKYVRLSQGGATGAEIRRAIKEDKYAQRTQTD